MDKPTISYATHASTSPEAEIATLAAVYSFVLRKKAGGSDAGENDARKVKDACTAEKEVYPNLNCYPTSVLC